MGKSKWMWVVALVGALLVPAAADADPRKKVVPVIECVVKHDDGTYTASFGYLNGNHAVIDLAPGTDKNDFSPSPDNRGQPGSFAPGRQRHAFKITVPTAVDLRWSLDGQTVTANEYTTPCVTKGHMTGNRVRTFWTNGSWKNDRWGLKAWFDLPCNPLMPKRLKVQWNRAGEPYRTFTLSSISWTFCWNDPTLSPGLPVAGFDSLMGVGLGSLDGKPAAIEWLVVDRGERAHKHKGRATDRAGFIIRDHLNRVVLARDLTTLEGNVEASDDY